MSIASTRSKYHFTCDRCKEQGELDAKSNLVLTSPPGWCNVSNTIGKGLCVKDIGGDLCRKCTATLREWMTAGVAQ